MIPRLSGGENRVIILPPLPSFCLIMEGSSEKFSTVLLWWSKTPNLSITPLPPSRYHSPNCLASRVTFLGPTNWGNYGRQGLSNQVKYKIIFCFSWNTITELILYSQKRIFRPQPAKDDWWQQKPSQIKNSIETYNCHASWSRFIEKYRARQVPLYRGKKKSEAKRHEKVKTCQNHQRPGRGL